jgi:3-oxoacyl-[acyl-carrier-protein] synthase II
VAVLGTGCASPAVFAPGALGAALSAGMPLLSTSHALGSTHAGVIGGAVPAIPASHEVGDHKLHRLMSRGARLGSIAARAALEHAGLDGEARERAGWFYGVGASGSEPAEIAAVVGASLDDEHAWSERRLCERGLKVFHPLRTFALMPNMTLCHSAIALGVRGPSAAVFSRGVGTVDALAMAALALADGECSTAIAGGADTALDCLTWAELVREGHVERGLLAGEGAGAIVVARSTERAIAWITGTAIRAAGSDPARAIREVLDDVGPADSYLVAAWGAIGDAARSVISQIWRRAGADTTGALGRLAPAGTTRSAPSTDDSGEPSGAQRILDQCAVIGDALAAAPALAWCAAIDLVRDGHHAVVALSSGVDGEVAAVRFAAVAEDPRRTHATVPSSPATVPSSQVTVPSSPTTVPSPLATVMSSHVTVPSSPATVTLSPASVTSSPASVTSSSISVASAHVTETSMPATGMSAPETVTSALAPVMSALATVASAHVTETSIPATGMSAPETMASALAPGMSALASMPSSHVTAMARRAVITGVGVVSSFGTGFAALLDGLAAGKSAIRPLTCFDASSLAARIAGQVPVDTLDGEWLAANLPSALHAAAARWVELGALRDRKVGFALVAAAEAWRHARLSASQPIPLVLAAGLERALIQDLAPVMQAGRITWELEARRARPAVRNRAAVDLAARAVADVLGLDHTIVHVSACAAGALAVALGAALVERGAPIVICGATDSMLDPIGVGGMIALGTTSPRAGDLEACRPFDRRRDGLVLGEGAAVFVVEDEGHAAARGARVLAQVLGWGASQDAYKPSAPNPDGVVSAIAMRRALDRAGVSPDQLGYINAHGTGTPLNDVAEIRAIRRALGESAERVPISSIKGAVGHLMAASGAIEIAASLLAFERDLLPGTANHRERDPECNLDVIGEAPRPARVDTVMSSSFGFGGHNAAP